MLSITLKIESITGGSEEQSFVLTSLLMIANISLLLGAGSVE
jgi:hypothetical protein